MLYKALHYLASGYLWPHLLFSSHVSLLSVLQQTQRVSTSGPPHLGRPLLGRLGSSMSMWLIFFLPFRLLLNYHMLRTASLTLLSKNAPFTFYFFPLVCFSCGYLSLSENISCVHYCIVFYPLLCANPPKWLEGREFV